MRHLLTGHENVIVVVLWLLFLMITCISSQMKSTSDILTHPFDDKGQMKEAETEEVDVGFQPQQRKKIRVTQSKPGTQ